jgi:hypothetical protein
MRTVQDDLIFAGGEKRAHDMNPVLVNRQLGFHAESAKNTCSV